MVECFRFRPDTARLLGPARCGGRREITAYGTCCIYISASGKLYLHSVRVLAIHHLL